MSFGPIAVATFRTLQSAQGDAVVYRRGSAQIDDLPAVLGHKDYQVTDSNGTTVTWDSHDFLIAAEDLMLSGSRVEPQRGDIIVRTADGRVQTFEVSFPDRTQRPFRRSGPAGTVLRVHATLISEAAA